MLPGSGLAPSVTAKTLVVILVSIFNGVPLTIIVLPVRTLVPRKVTRQGLGPGPLHPILKVAITSLCRKTLGKQRPNPLNNESRLELAIITGTSLLVPTPPRILNVLGTGLVPGNRPNTLSPARQTCPTLLLLVLQFSLSRSMTPTAVVLACFLRRQVLLPSRSTLHRPTVPR